jgi:hypothetical protein
VSDQSEKEEIADIAKVDAALAVLAEHFDTVQVFATRHEAGQEDGTISVQKGLGNWFARYGQVQEWLVTNDERSRLKAHE